MDAVVARRTQAGATVVHGVHAVLWTLETLFLAREMTEPLASLVVQFQKFIYVGAEVELQLKRTTPGAWRVVLLSEGVTTSTIDLTFGSPATAVDTPLSTTLASYATPANLTLSDLEGRSGLLPIPRHAEIAHAFPATAHFIGDAPVGAIVSLSALVGMVCPGLHSIFDGFTIAMTDQVDKPHELGFAVRSIDARVRMAEIRVGGRGINGTVTAFLRHPPIQQQSLENLRGVIRRDEFDGCSALVIGGSRGLGALTAAIIVAGGGQVKLTYASGELDARAVARDLGLDSASVFRYNAMDDAASQMPPLTGVNQLYYFATTHISRQKSGYYSPNRFAEFTKIYVDGFADACEALSAQGGVRFAAFYPSSTYVADRPRYLTEYAMAKGAGEALCADMNRFFRGTTVVCKRLPKILTDQTATVMPSENADPLGEMLPVVREMRARLQTAR